jgi:tetratricopeptide (TPR) repeat protein
MLDLFDKFPKIYSFCTNVRYFRKKRKLTGQKLGEKISYSEAWISNLENHKYSELPVDVEKRIGDALAIDPAVLICEYDPFRRLIVDTEKLTKSKEFADAIRNADDAIEMSEAMLGPIDQVKALFKRGNIEYYTRNFNQALVYYENALERAIAARDWRCVHLSRQNLAVAYRELAKYDLAEQELLKDLSSVRDVEARRSSLLKLVDMYIHQEKWANVNDSIEELLGESPIDRRILMICLQYKSVMKLNLNELEEAASISEQVIELSRQFNDITGEVCGLLIKGDALILLGRSDEGLESLEAASNIAPEEMIHERIQIDFLKTFCIKDEIEAFQEMKQVILRLEKLNGQPRVLSKMCARAAGVAHRLREIDDLNALHVKSRQHLRAIIR